MSSWCEYRLTKNVQPLPKGRTGVRSHQGFIVLLAKALKGNNRRQLLAEMARGVFAQDLYANSEEELSRFHDDWLSAIPACAVALQLLVYPGMAQRIVRQTVNNYSLSENAAKEIRNLVMPALEASLN